jgi:opacity protein-like surface antigen
MHIKSLFLGGVMALTALSGASAEDAVVADDPLGTGTVNVCDAYGTGYTHVAGAGTCVKASGQVRYEKSFGSRTTRGSHGRVTLDFETRSD